MEMQRKKIGGSTGWIESDALHIPITVNNQAVGNMVFDTGNFELMFSTETATRIGITATGKQQIEGVDGIPFMAYTSTCTLQIGKRSFKNVPCIINHKYKQSDGLFGLRFLIDRNIDAEVCINPPSVNFYKEG